MDTLWHDDCLFRDETCGNLFEMCYTIPEKQITGRLHATNYPDFILYFQKVIKNNLNHLFWPYVQKNGIAFPILKNILSSQYVKYLIATFKRMEWRFCRN